MILYETQKAGWTVREHLARKNVDGVCGLDVLHDSGIEFTDKTTGDIEVAIDGVTDSPENAIFYIIEPPLTLPSAYLEIAHRPFLARFLDIDTDHSYVEKICGPGLDRVYKAHFCSLLDYKSDWGSKTKHMCSVLTIRESINKFTEEYGLYHLRESMLKSCADRYGDRFDFYSRNGGDSMSNFRGELKDDRRYDFPKLDHIAKYDFVLTLENSSFKGYVNKIDHPLISRAIPIYMGAPDVGDYVPKELFIDVADYDNFEDCLDYVDSLSAEKVKNWQGDIDAFIKDSSATKKLSSLFLADEFVRCMGDLGC